MDLIEAPEQTSRSEPLLSLWLLSCVVPELRGELQDVATGPGGQQRQDIAQVSVRFGDRDHLSRIVIGAPAT